MKEKKEIEVLFKAIERLISKNPKIQKFIDKSIMVYVKKRFFLFFIFFVVVFIIMSYPNISFLCAKENSL